MSLPKEELEAIRDDLEFGLIPGRVTQQVRALVAEVERLRGVVEAHRQLSIDARGMASLCSCAVPRSGNCPRCRFDAALAELEANG